MDQQSSERIARFRKAGVPTRMLKTTAAKEGLPLIPAIIESKQYLDKTLYRNYLIEGAPKIAFKAASVFARELSLARIAVHFLSGVQIARDLRLSEKNFDNTQDYQLALGSGYWVVTELDELNDHPTTEIREVESLVTRHVNRGGGLILYRPSLYPLPSSFIDMIEAFETIKV